MHRSKIIGILKTFTKREISDFERFVRSPFHNRMQKCVELISILKDFYPDFDHFGLEKERIFKRLYPDKKKFDSGLSVITSHLMELLKEYLIVRRLDKNEDLKDTLLLKELLDSGDTRLFKVISNRKRKRLAETPKKDIDYYYHSYLFEETYFRHEQESRNMNVDPRSLVRKFDEYYVLNKLKLTCDSLNYANVIPVGYDLTLLDEVLKLVEANHYDNFLIGIYNTILHSIRDSENEDHFYKLKEKLKTYANDISPEVLDRFYIFITNYAIRKVVQGKSGYLNELFELYMDMVTNGAILEKGIIPHNRMKNVVSLGSKLGKFDWTENFIKDHKGLLKKEYRHSVYNYNMGSLMFYKGNHIEAMGYLNKIEGIDVFYEIGRKFVLLKIYYELDEPILYFNLAASFKEYIRKNKVISESYRVGYNNFVNALSLVYRIKTGDSKKKKNILEKEIDQQKYNSDKKWLLEKISQLK